MSYWIAGAATVGALTNPKKPLKGALTGAAIGATGGAAAGAFGGAGLLGGAGAAGGSAGGLLGTATGGAGATGAAGASGTAGFGLGQPLVTGSLGSSAVAGAPAAGASPGLLGTVAKYKPVMDAAANGLQMSGALDPEQPMQAPEPMQVQGGAEALAGIASQSPAAQAQSDQSERARRRAMLRGGV